MDARNLTGFSFSVCDDVGLFVLFVAPDLLVFDFCVALGGSDAINRCRRVDFFWSICCGVTTVALLGVSFLVLDAWTDDVRAGDDFSV